eukprot:TRINITY_DN102_c3_g1_i2.p3 TRINITY_DN102_c3_g1~~TRINITY_DN102_c3_g1_i2.p3  ORF type:complete len:116 (-),score=13.84 TRINITY_DN102_c3_g1_i2:51-398(-)
MFVEQYLSRFHVTQKAWLNGCVSLYRQSILDWILWMGKGDKRTKRGKIFKGTYGKMRPRYKLKEYWENPPEGGNPYLKTPEPPFGGYMGPVRWQPAIDEQSQQQFNQIYLQLFYR